MKHSAPFLAYLASLAAGLPTLAIWGDLPAVAALTGYAMGATVGAVAAINHYRDKARREEQARLDARWIGYNA